MGCSSIPKGAASVDDVTIHGNEFISSGDIEEKLATTPSAKFFGIFRGVIYDYSLFDAGVLQRDLGRVERYYRARGFYEAHARAGRVVYTSDNHVLVTIEVEEGPRVLVAKPLLTGIEKVRPKAREAVRAELESHLKTGAAFEEEPFDQAEAEMVRALTDRGYAWAKIERHANVDLVAHRAYPSFVVTPGPLAKFGPVKVEGLRELPEKPVLRATDIEPGARYSTVTTGRAREAVIGLGAFSSVEVIPVLADPPPDDAVVPIVVRVQTQKLKSVLIGGGIELDSLKTQFHLHVGWEHKNLFGGFRNFTVDVKPGIDLYPTRIPSFQAPTAVLPEERFRASFRQPGFIEARTVGVVTQELNTYPVILSPKVDPQASVIGYLEYKGSAGLERTLWKLFASPTYNIQYDLPFSYKGKLDPDLRGIVISYIDALGHFDLRDDRMKPHSGLYIQNDVQFAGLGGAARDFRIQPEIRGYIPLGKKVTIAARSTVGFLFPLDYGIAAKTVAQGGTVNRARLIEDIEIIYLRGFFSGGPSSNRGYPLRGVGPHGSVPFFNPGLQAQELAQACGVSTKTYDPIRCGVPLGGLSLWEASLELRFPIIDPLSGAVFCDAGDVSATPLTLRLNYPHLSCGAGLRYDTPVGPIRIDVGYRVPGAQYPKTADVRIEGEPGTIFGAPLAFAFGLGESF